MNNLKYRQKKIQEKRKKTPWRDFVKEIASWVSLSFYKQDGVLTRYPKERITNITSAQEFDEGRDAMLQYGREYDASK